MNIINSPIIKTEYDEFWNDVPSLENALSPLPVLIITNRIEKDSAENTQLLKMLGACNLVTEVYNIIQIGKEEKIAWHKLREKADPKFILLIGILPVQLGISAMFRLNEPNHFNDRVWLPTLSINELEQNQDLKKQFWQNGMKPVFFDKLFGSF